MQLRYPDYYPKFQCTASACQDNCCIGWEIDIDAESCARYRCQPGDFGERLRKSISGGAEPHFLLRKERCPFLNEKNLCDIILTLGEGALCEICTQHPRFHEWFGGVKESGVGLCCEAAARLILQSPQPAAFVSAEIDEEPVPGFEEEGLLAVMVPAREHLFALLQDRAHSVGERLGAALVFACALQECLDGENPAEAVAELNRFCRTERAFFFQKAEGYAPQRKQGEERALWAEMLSFLLTLEPIDADWPKRLRGISEELGDILKAQPGFFGEYAPRLYAYEHLAVYFVYRYLLKAVYDGDVLSKVKLMAVSVLCISLLDTACWREKHRFLPEDRVRIAVGYSKEIEYCQENLTSFSEASWQNPCFSAENLLVLLGRMSALEQGADAQQRPEKG